MVMDRTQHIPVFGYVFVNPRSNVRFVRLILEPYGSITESMLEASISQDGMEAIVKITFEGGTGEIMNAKHTEKRYPNVGPFHHFIVSMKQAARFYSERHENEEVFVKVKLPFACEIHGFYDPIDDVDDFLDLGIFSLDHTSDNIVANAPPPSTKFLNLFCEEKNKPKVKQKMNTKSYGFSKQSTSPNNYQSLGSSNDTP
jgi:hypothetical protein